jgi:hypothetical protein
MYLIEWDDRSTKSPHENIDLKTTRLRFIADGRPELTTKSTNKSKEGQINEEWIRNKWNIIN